MKQIITIWGGTWTFNLVSGLKKIPDVFVNTIVTMSDDGGSTWFLRDEYGILPPGDLRRALVALSEGKKSIFLRKLFSYRFKSGLLKGHNLGNLIMMAAEDIEWDYWKALDELEEMLWITKWKVFPATLEKTRLVAKLETGEYIIWETNIDIPKHSWNEKIVDLFVVKEEYAHILKKIKEFGKEQIFEVVLEQALEDKPLHNPFLEEILEKADYILIGPGDLYTSILPNILVWKMQDLLKKSKAKKIYIANLFTKFGETNDFALSDFLKVFEKYLWKDFFDYIIVQDWDKVALPEDIILQYEAENKKIVKTDINSDKIVKANVVNLDGMIRHDKNKLAGVISDILWN